MASEARKQAANEQLFDGRFVLGDVIGRGRQSIVYRAEQLNPPTPLQRIVAVKLVFGSNKDPDGVFRRVRREALGMLAARSPHTVRLFDYVTSSEQPYLVMEYAERGDLKAHVTRQGGSLDLSQAIDFTIQTLEGLSAVHRAGMIHRDMKAENLLLINHQTVKLADFSIAWVPNEYLSLEKANPVVGTFDYLAPESLNDGISSVRSDLYSVAMTLYELITGIYPFGDGPFSEQVSRKLAGMWTPLPEYLNPVPKYLPELFRVGLSSNPNDRFGSAEEFIKALQAIRAGNWQPPVRLSEQLRVPLHDVRHFEEQAVPNSAADSKLRERRTPAPPQPQALLHGRSMLKVAGVAAVVASLAGAAFFYRDRIKHLPRHATSSSASERAPRDEQLLLTPPLDGDKESSTSEEPTSAASERPEEKLAAPLAPRPAAPNFEPTYSIRLAQYPGLSAAALMVVAPDAVGAPERLVLRIENDVWTLPILNGKSAREFIALFPTPERDFEISVSYRREGEELVSQPLAVALDCLSLGSGEGDDSALADHPLLAKGVKLAAQVEFLSGAYEVAKNEGSLRKVSPAPATPAHPKAGGAHRFSCLMANPTSKLLALKTQDLQTLMEVRSNKVEILEKQLNEMKTGGTIAKLNARAEKANVGGTPPIFSQSMPLQEFAFRLTMLGIAEDARRR